MIDYDFTKDLTCFIVYITFLLFRRYQKTDEKHNYDA